MKPGEAAILRQEHSVRVALESPLPFSLLSRFCGGNSDFPVSVRGIATDSREIEPGDLFLAFRGEREDGLRYLPEALKKGSPAAISETPCTNPLVLQVDDLRAVLGNLAVYLAGKVKHKTIAVTGSVGKTTVNTFLSQILSQRYRVHFTPGNRNTDIGVPLTMLSMNRNTELLILEFGMRARGEIRYLSELAKPNIGVLTNIGSSHLASLGSRNEILAAKLEIISGMSYRAPLFFNAEDPMLGICRALPVTALGLSISNGNTEYCLKNEEDGKCLFSAPGRQISGITLAGEGDAFRFAALAAASVADFLELSDEEIRGGLAECRMPELRQSFLHRDGVTYLLDCYNASPESMRAAFSCLHAHRGEGRISALLGDMLELGDESEALHRETGERFARLHPYSLFCYGKNARKIGDGAEDAGMSPLDIFRFTEEESGSAARLIRSRLLPGDILLIKASRALRAERILSLILSPPCDT